MPLILAKSMKVCVVFALHSPAIIQVVRMVDCPIPCPMFFLNICPNVPQGLFVLHLQAISRIFWIVGWPFRSA